jgi:hypothetical protein
MLDGLRRKNRSTERRTSIACTGVPSWYVMSLRIANVYVRPSSVGVGIEFARLGTKVDPSEPPTRLKPTRPSFVNSSVSHALTVWASGSAGSSVVGIRSGSVTMRRLPPRWLPAPARAVNHVSPPARAMPRGRLCTATRRSIVFAVGSIRTMSAVEATVTQTDSPAATVSG